LAKEKEHLMTPQEKPEWIEMAESDNAGASRKTSKGLPAIALMAFAAIIGVGAVVAQTPGESPASAVESASPSLQSSQPSATSQSSPSKSVTTATHKESISLTASPTPSDIANPAIATMPTGGGDDDESDDEGEDD